METKDWNYFSRTYSAADITLETVILTVETYGLSCGPAGVSISRIC